MVADQTPFLVNLEHAILANPGSIIGAFATSIGGTIGLWYKLRADEKIRQQQRADSAALAAAGPGIVEKELRSQISQGLDRERRLEQQINDLLKTIDESIVRSRVQDTHTNAVEAINKTYKSQIDDHAADALKKSGDSNA